MAWARLDDGFHDHPKVDQLSLAAVGLYTLCLTWAHRHRKTAIIPGHITEARVRKLAGKQTDVLAQELVMARLWEVEPNLGGWEIHDFADYLPKERDPEERKEAGRKGADARWQRDSKPDGKLPGTSMVIDGSRASAPASPSRPVPNVELNQGGDRNEPLRAVPAANPPNNNDDACTRHPDGNPGDEPCRGCQRVEERRERRAARDADKAAREREQLRNACTRCDGVWITNDDGSPSKRKCDHRRTA